VLVQCVHWIEQLPNKLLKRSEAATLHDGFMKHRLCSWHGFQFVGGSAATHYSQNTGNYQIVRFSAHSGFSPFFCGTRQYSPGRYLALRAWRLLGKCNSFHNRPEKPENYLWRVARHSPGCLQHKQGFLSGFQEALFLEPDSQTMERRGSQPHGQKRKQCFLNPVIREQDVIHRLALRTVGRDDRSE
jgi:hypothetical protein